MAERIIEVQHLSKTFGTHEVLKDIDFSVQEGDVTCILGASGSGKSTLLRCINLLETPSGGQILFHGTPSPAVGSTPCAYRAKVGMVFQSFNLFANLTVLENCTIGQRKVLKKKRRRGRGHSHGISGKGGPCSNISRQSPTSFRAGKNSAWPLPAPWPCGRKCFCSTSPPARWTHRWWARCWP